MIYPVAKSFFGSLVLINEPIKIAKLHMMVKARLLSTEFNNIGLSVPSGSLVYQQLLLHLFQLHSFSYPY